ncbi:MAG: thiamine pyrophosphate-dependent enzyme, partial [Pseudomonadota bacterium]
HSKSDRNRYRSKDEIAAWMEKDPIPRFADMLVGHGVLSAADVAAIEAEADAEITAAIAFARAGTDPDPAEVTHDVYTPVYTPVDTRADTPAHTSSHTPAGAVA